MVGDTGEAATVDPAGLAADTAPNERKGGNGVLAAMGVMALGVRAASEFGTAMVIDLPASSPRSFLTAPPPMA